MKRRRHKGELFVGMQIEHWWRKKAAPLGTGFDWHATITEIPEDSDEIEVRITGGNGGSWIEHWDRKITENGLLQGEYLELEETK